MPDLSNAHASRAVLVGVYGYAHNDQLADLPSVKNNLTAFKDTLTDPRIWGLPEQNVTVIPQPDRASEVIDGVTDAFAAATDTVLFYYAGHGLPDLASQELYLALPTSLKNRRDTACRYEDIALHFRKSRHVRRIVVVLDCCYSGLAVSTMSAGDDLANRAGTPLGRNLPPGRTYCVLTASASTEEALAPVGATYTSFTDALLSRMETGIPNGPPHLDMETLYEHVRADLLNRPSTEDGRLPGTPDFGSRGAPSDVSIARNRAVPPLSAPESAPVPRPVPTPGPRPRVPARMAALVRAYLTEQSRQVNSLHMVRPAATSESRVVRRARQEHHLDQFESLIALWVWLPRTWGQQDSLAFTTHGIRIVDRATRHHIPYGDLPKYKITSEPGSVAVDVGINSYMPMTRKTIDLLVIGPDLRWFRVDVGEDVGNWLTHIRQLVSGQ